jgi:hypothetical protein
MLWCFRALSSGHSLFSYSISMFHCYKSLNTFTDDCLMALVWTLGLPSCISTVDCRTGTSRLNWICSVLLLFTSLLEHWLFSEPRTPQPRSITRVLPLLFPLLYKLFLKSFLPFNNSNHGSNAISSERPPLTTLRKQLSWSLSTHLSQTCLLCSTYLGLKLSSLPVCPFRQTLSLEGLRLSCSLLYSCYSVWHKECA